MPLARPSPAVQTSSFVTMKPAASKSASPYKSNLQYTSNPWGLLGHDLLLLAQQSWSLPFIVLPVTPFVSKSLDELYPDLGNIWCIAVHTVLVFAQCSFIGLLFLSIIAGLPISFVLIGSASFLIGNYYVCKWLLNGCPPTLDSKADISHFPDTHQDEKWIFLNGVAVGSHWLQNNIDRISLTFGRKVQGVHNPTAGIVFDILQCIVQRDFSYVTQDIRNGYGIIKEALISSERNYKKVVLILHSQGGIEGGLILDWLLAEVPVKSLEKLEIYTFGNAANHWNNPDRMEDAAGIPNGNSIDQGNALKVIKHIEHYANKDDFVSRWGVLHFASASLNPKVQNNRFSGLVFERNGKGHQFNQHYLDTMFPLCPNIKDGASEDNAFMYKPIKIAESLPKSTASTSAYGNGWEHSLSEDFGVLVHDLTMFNGIEAGRSLLSPVTRKTSTTVGELSRLWKYRNGKSPKD